MFTGQLSSFHNHARGKSSCLFSEAGDRRFVSTCQYDIDFFHTLVVFNICVTLKSRFVFARQFFFYFLSA